MNFASMNPADRLKASGLIGLIVVLLFFIVHTLLGALAPKKPAGTLSNAPAAGAPPPPPPVGEPLAASASPGNGMLPEGSKVASRGNLREDPGLGLDVHDPFVPIRDPAGKLIAGGKSQPPKVELQPLPSFGDMNPMRPVGQVPSVPMAGGGALPGLESAPSPGAPPAVAAAPPVIEPEIKLIGIVHGLPSVATMQVAGRIMLVRPGDALAKGYRLMAVDPEGVTLRHLEERLSLRVGAAINDTRP